MVVAVACIVFQSEAFKQVSFKSSVINKKTALADFSVLHDSGIISSSIDGFNHIVSEVAKTDFHSLHSTFNIADGDVAAAPASIYSKVDKTGFIGTCADYIEQAIDLSHTLFVNLGIKNSYGFSIILFTFLSKYFTCLYFLASILYVVLSAFSSYTAPFYREMAMTTASFTVLSGILRILKHPLLVFG